MDKDLISLAEDLLSKVKSFNNFDSSTPSVQSELFHLREDIRATATLIAHTIDGPEQFMKAIARGFTTCSALKICVDLELAGHLPRTGGLSLKELACSTGCDARVLRPLLRLLAQNNIFHQTPDKKWHHTSLSAIMTQPPFRAWMKSILEEKYYSVSHLPQFLAQTSYRFPAGTTSPFKTLYSTPQDFYTHTSIHLPTTALNFALSMSELALTQLPFLEAAYPLHTLPQNGHFVDVAGGLGNLTYFLAEKLPSATFEVQDLPLIVAEGEKGCPISLKKRVRFRAHDMLLPQPARERLETSVVFLLKIILHDHGDEACMTILRNLLRVMEKGDRILVIDTVIPEVGGSLGACCSDVIILGMFGCGHRTLGEWESLIRGSGEGLVVRSWKGGMEERDGMTVMEIQKG